MKGIIFFLIAVLIILVQAPPAHATIITLTGASPNVYGEVFDDFNIGSEAETATLTLTPTISQSSTSAQNANFEFDITSFLSAGTSINSAILNFTVTPTLLDPIPHVSFNMATYGAGPPPPSLTLDDFNPIFDNSNYFNSGNFSVATNFSIDVHQSVGGNIGPGIGPFDTPAYRFIITTTTMPPPSTTPVSSAQFSNVQLVIDYDEESSPPIVPEPSTFALLTTGLVGLGGVALRRKLNKAKLRGCEGQPLTGCPRIQNSKILVLILKGL